MAFVRIGSSFREELSAISIRIEIPFPENQSKNAKSFELLSRSYDQALILSSKIFRNPYLLLPGGLETFLVQKSGKNTHYYNYGFIRETNAGKQMRNVWEMSAPRKEEKKFGKHPTQKPVELLERIILASTPEKALVLDPFCGSSSTGVAAIRLKRRYVGIDNNEDFLKLSIKRIEDEIKHPKIL